MSPGLQDWLSAFFKPRYFGLLSRPFLLEPPVFLDANRIWTPIFSIFFVFRCRLKNHQRVEKC